MLPHRPSSGLIKAAKAGDLLTATDLLDHGAAVDKAGIDGYTPLIWAADKGHTEMVRLLIDAGADIHAQATNRSTALACAVRNNHAETAHVLIQGGADINEKDYYMNDTQLMMAVYGSHTAMVRLLIDDGADLNRKNKKGDTALGIAEKKSNREIIRLLTEAAALQKQKETEIASRPAEPWVIPETEPEKLVHIGLYPEIQTKLTEIFNFAGRERLMISEDLKTGAKTAPVSTAFDDLPQAALKTALEEFKRLGGVADEDFALRGSTRLDKSGPRL